VFGIFILLSQLLTAVVVFGGFLGVSSPGSQAFFALSRVAALVATIVALLVASRFIDRRPFRQFGFRMDGGWWLDLLFGLALGALLMTGVFLAELAAGWVRITDFLQSPGGTGFAAAIALPLVTFVCVGISEEALARGYLLRNAGEGFNLPAVGPQAAIVVAWLLSSAIFGFLHAFNPNASAVSTFNIFLAGLFLGLGYVLTGQLAIPIGLHVTWNFFQGSVYGFPVSGIETPTEFVGIDQGGSTLITGGPFGPEAGLVGVGAMASGSLLILGWVRLRNGKLSLQTQQYERP
jgi:membrane protease YdiL (CAAX protease family)